MSIIYIIIFNIFANLYSAWKLGLHFSNEDCYESFTLPKYVLKLFHYNPTGPKFLNIQFRSIIYYSPGLSHKVEFSQRYDFKKINGSCESSLIFSKKPDKIYDMEIIIKINISPFFTETAYMSYMFLDGFAPDVYLFVDQFSHFGLSAQVIYSNESFMQKVNKYSNATVLYLSSLEIDKSDICIMTENNHRLIIHPHYHDSLSKGFIVGIKSTFENTEYQAFECFVNRNYPYENAVFIFENYPKFSPHFMAIYAIMEGTIIKRKEVSFFLGGVNLYNVANFPHFSPRIEKLFLMESNPELITCKDGTHIVLYKSGNEVPFYAIKAFQIEIKANVFCQLFIPYSPSTNCD